MVRRYQDFLPASVSKDLATTAFPPQAPLPVPESDQEAGPSKSPPKPRHRVRPKGPHRKDSVSDFEHSYAANVAPRYLAHRRPLGGPGSRIPGPSAIMDSRDSSRRTSPDKRSAYQKRPTESNVTGGRISPTPVKTPPAVPPTRAGKSRIVSRNPQKERAQVHRTPSTSGSRVLLRRPSAVAPGSKVSNIARHFERISRDNDKTNRRYAVIRGRRARPVASARATVEVFDSVREAIRDESDESASSSEADDEDEGDDDKLAASEVKSAPVQLEDASPPQTTSAASDSNTLHPVPVIELSFSDNSTSPIAMAAPAIVPPISLPSSPVLTSQMPQTPCETPPHSDLEAGPSTTERHSTILKALTGLWPHHAGVRSQLDFEGDDPMADPEHIFRESSMVVRTDEPTSIIALALKYVHL